MLAQLLSNKENCLQATGKLLKGLGIKVTTTTLEKDLINHPDYPSLLSVSDALGGYGVKNISFKSSIEKLEGMPLPFMAQIKGEKNFQNLFTVVQAVKDNTLSYYNPERYRWDTISKKDFSKRWPSGIVLLAEAEESAGEKDYAKKYNEERIVTIAKQLLFLALPSVAIIAGVGAFVTYGAAATYPVIFLLLTLLGSIIGALLLWYEIDQYNPVLQQICSGGKKVNCSAVLQSKASKIAGISWSAIGFTYFTGGLLLLLFTGVNNSPYLFTLAWLNVLAIPYVLFSIYYQWRIAKQWCTLCLAIQGLLVLQLFTAVIAGWHTIIPIALILSAPIVIPIILAYLVPFLMVSLLLPAYRAAKESRRTKIELQRLKHNPQIFNALLAKQKAVTESTNGLGITLGNPNAAYKIIKVCNPYCGPCAKAHTPIEELLHNNPDVQVQIIFNATNDEDIKAAPVRHFLAIAEKDNESVTQQALDDWYLSENKDYEQFASKYPMNGELKKQGEKLEAMSNWCNKNEILFTPTFFVNGYQLPEIYTVNDLKYFLSQ